MWKYSFLILFALTLSVPSLGGAAEKALVIIDMQDKFLEDNGYFKLLRNQSVIEKLFAKQIEMIRLAKKQLMPILVIEYRKEGPTTEDLWNELRDYPKTVVFDKRTNGVFERDNDNLERVKAQLKDWNATELIVMGANGPSCVEKTINGALAAKFKVLAFSDGIVDFNRREFAYPYKYPNIKNSQFEEFSNPARVCPVAYAQPAGASGWQKIIELLPQIATACHLR